MLYDVWSWLVFSLGNGAYDGEVAVSTRKIEMFSSSTDESTKARILKDFRCIVLLIFEC